jgi:GDP-fucose protein O-fucosyltransferase
MSSTPSLSSVFASISNAVKRTSVSRAILSDRRTATASLPTSSSHRLYNEGLKFRRYLLLLATAVLGVLVGIAVLNNTPVSRDSFSSEFIDIIHTVATDSTPVSKEVLTDSAIGQYNEGIKQSESSSSTDEASSKTGTAAITTTTTTSLLRNNKDNTDDAGSHRVAGLSCEKYGGPLTNDALERMIFWHDIPEDSTFVSPLKHPTEEQFLTMEPDEGGWNNIRMNMESAVGIAIMTGRTLVLPPKMELYLLHHGKDRREKQYSFNDFFHFDSVLAEHYINRDTPTLKVITFQEFLEQVVMTGNFISQNTSLPTFPPENQTNWDQVVIEDQTEIEFNYGNVLWEWMRNSAVTLKWNWNDCVAAFPKQRGKDYADNIQNTYLHQIINPNNEEHPPHRDAWKQIASYIDDPTAVNDTPTKRLHEILADRNDVCIYDDVLQDAKVIHTYGSTEYRMLIHFYAFLFFENYHHDLWYKRFVRDHLRYVDEVQCAAARVIEEVTRRALQNSGDGDDTFDTIHIRRGDFQYKKVRHVSAEDIYKLTVKQFVKPNRTLFIATDETDMNFFEIFRQHYNVYFLHDFQEQLTSSVSKNYFGMIDQLVASQGTTFIGSYYSTFTGYINRIRGYHHQNKKLKGYELGHINSYYSGPKSLVKSVQNVMTTYRSVQQAFWQQEYAVCWRDIDHDVEEMH